MAIQEFPAALGLFDLNNFIQEQGINYKFLDDDNNLIINKKIEQKAKEKFSVSISIFKYEYPIFQDFYYMNIRNGTLPFSATIKKNNTLVKSLCKIISEIDNKFSENKLTISFDIIELYEIEKIY